MKQNLNEMNDQEYAGALAALKREGVELSNPDHPLNWQHEYDKKLYQAASVDETLDISTLDLLREIEQRVQQIHRTAELYANDEITAHETVKQIATIKTLLNKAIVKELSK